MSRLCRSVNVCPSVTTYCNVSTLVVSIVGPYTSDSTPPATVYQTLDEPFRAVPRQSLRAKSKCESCPGPSGAPLGSPSRDAYVGLWSPRTQTPVGHEVCLHQVHGNE